MIKIDNIKVYNIANAMHGARNPLNSWSRFDSDIESDTLGPNDLGLAKRLYAAGPEHAKYLRQIFVSMDITAPFYFWKEASTYKVGTTANSCSTMHRITSKQIEARDFSVDDTSDADFLTIVSICEKARKDYLATKDIKYWRKLIQLLPEGYMQKRTLTMSYANVMNIIGQREHHKLTEWHTMVAELRKLPYVKEIRGEGNE